MIPLLLTLAVLPKPRPLPPLPVAGILAIGAGADLLSTERALARCPSCYEKNPLGQSRALRVGLATAFTTGETFLVCRLSRRHRTMAKVVIVALVGGKLLIAAHNWRQVNGR